MHLEQQALNSPFSAQDVRCEARHTLWRGFFRIDRLTLSHRLFAGGWSPPLERELFVRGHAVGVLLYDPELQEVVMVEQFRVGAMGGDQSPWLIELVAGMVEEGETPQQVAVRECLEEAGCKPYRLLPITSYFSSPGGCDERVWLYCGLVSAAGLGGVHGLDSEQEDIRVLRLSLPAAQQAMQQGRLNNAMTLIGLQWLLLNRELIHGESEVEP